MENKQIAKAFLEAQKEMGDALKESVNPYFKSKYASLSSIRETCVPILNKHNIAVLQPLIQIDGKNFVKTLLLHESGETLEGCTEIVYSKKGDAQSQGSGITYARRYGLQSLVNICSQDDDGNAASSPPCDDLQELAILKRWLENCDNLEDLAQVWKSNSRSINYIKNNNEEQYQILLNCKEEMKNLLINNQS